MRRVISVIICLMLFSPTLRRVVAQSGGAASGSVSMAEDADGEPQRELVDVKADLVFPHKVGDSVSVLCLVGHFAAQHNGAVITADSAVRYEDDRLECYGNVLINKNTTYAYADWAEYNSAENLVALHSPLIKVVDEDVTLYTYNFTFNTLDNIGHYWDGGVATKLDSLPQDSVARDSVVRDTIQRDTMPVVMESQRGYYYADTKSLAAAGEVEMQGRGYQMKSDSVVYDMEAELAHFFTTSNIWSDKGYIAGDRGTYDRGRGRYVVTQSGYLLTDKYEVWSDSMEYRERIGEAVLRSNIQIDDTTHKMLAFGDYGKYWEDVERALLSRRATVINYDTSESDSLFLRGDTIELLSYAVGTGPIVDSAEIRRVAALKAQMAAASESGDEPSEEESEDPAVVTSDSLAVDSVAVDSVAVDSVKVESVPSERELKREAKRVALEAKRKAKLDAARARDYRKLDVRRAKYVERMDERRADGKDILTDSLIVARLESEMANLLPKDSVAVDSAAVDSVAVESAVDSIGTEASSRGDSLYRIVKAYGDVRSYRSDVQMVCDSMVAISFDSIMKLYISPVLWSDNNQVASEQVDLYTANGELDYADFVGDPISSDKVVSGDSVYYNQIKGKSMQALFKNNEIVRNNVDGNVETLYFMQDEKTGDITTVAYVQSGSASFYIDKQQLEGVTYRKDPTYIFAPLTKLPADLSLTLDGFKWYGEERPTRETIFEQEIRPTERAYRDSLPRPTFPIDSVMQSLRVELEQQGGWFDREEQVSPDAVEWMLDLGYTVGEPRE